MLPRASQFNSWASDLQVEQAVPDLLRLFVGEDTRVWQARFAVRNVLEDVLVPKDLILNKLLVCQCSHCATIVISTEPEHIPLNLHVDVVVEKTLSAHILLHKHLQSVNKIRICHLRHVQR